MKKSILSFILLFSAISQAQFFSYDPSAAVYAELPMDMITEIYTYITNETDDTLFIEWRKIEDTLPLAGEPGEGWFKNMCDFGSCWDYLPNTAVMIPPIAPGGAGFLKLMLNPQNLPGAGAVHYWVYPEGQMDMYEDVWFYVWTPGLNVNNEGTTQTSVYPNPVNGHLTIDGATMGNYLLLDSSGRLVNIFTIGGPSRIIVPVEHLEAGLYFLQTPSLEKIRIIIE